MLARSNTTYFGTLTVVSRLGSFRTDRDAWVRRELVARERTGTHVLVPSSVSMPGVCGIAMGRKGLPGCQSLSLSRRSVGLGANLRRAAIPSSNGVDRQGGLAPDDFHKGHVNHLT